MSTADASAAPAPRFRVGDWLVDATACVLERDGQRIALEPRLMEVLVVLGEFGGEVVSAEQLLIECWRGTFYGDNPVHKAVAQLRRALGDSATAPRYVATVRKRGYRLVAPVVFPEGFSGLRRLAATRWTQGAPYVGLSAFEASHGDVFFGRTRALAEVLAALRRRLDEERGFLLLLGPSGCGKSSLLRAGVLPLLTQAGGFDGCRVLVSADVDPAHAAADADAALADAMLAWQVGGEAVFLPGEREFLIGALADDAAALAARVGERLARRGHPGRERRVALLVLDQLEQFLLAAGSDSIQLQRLFQTLAALLRGGHVMALAAGRDDFYSRIAALPALHALRLDGGSFDLPLLNPGELAQIIRGPAQAAGLRFEIDPTSLQRLDDVLRDDAIRQEQPLPLLQHALLEIYQQRNGGLLTFAGYRAIGGLEGALAQRAEQTFAALPPSTQQRLPLLLRQMVVLAGDDALPLGRRIAWSDLADAQLRQLAQAFVERRLFVAASVAGVAGVAAAHEALFRNWPRARDWIAENRRLLLGRARLAAACQRWREENRRNDFLLPRGSQLDDARELLLDTQAPLDLAAREFVDASVRRSRRRRAVDLLGASLVLVLAVLATFAGMLAVLARDEANDRRAQAESLVGYMLGDLTERLRALGKLDVLDSVGNEALRYLRALPDDDASASAQLLRIRASRQVGEIRFARGEAAAADAFAHAGELAERLVQREPGNADAWLELGNAAFWRGQAAYQSGAAAAAALHWQRYREAAQQLVVLRGNDERAQMELSYALNNLATLDFDARRLPSARRLFAESAALKRAALDAGSTDAGIAADLADSLTWQSRVEEAALQLDAAEARQREALQVIGELRQREPEDQRWIHRDALARQHLARTCLARGNAEQAAQLLLAARSALDGLAQADPANLEWARDAVVAQVQAGTVLEYRQPAAARDLLRSTATKIQALLPRSGGDLPALLQLARLRLLRLEPPAPPGAERELADMAQRLRAQRDQTGVAGLAANVLVQVLLTQAELAAQHTDSTAASLAVQAGQLLTGLPATEDAATLDMRLRAARLSGDRVAAHVLRQRLEAAGYRHPDYLRFIATYLSPEPSHE